MTTILTCGHSNRTREAYVAFLQHHGVTRYVDVRRWPGSRRHPQFARDVLADTLEGARIAYVHEEALGGHREPRENTVNTGLGEPWLQGYADHLASPAFREALARTLAAAEAEEVRGGRLVVACAERHPGECHRQVLADALVAAGARVLHAVDDAPPREHEPPACAVFEGGTVTYPAPEPMQGTLFEG